MSTTLVHIIHSSLVTEGSILLAVIASHVHYYLRSVLIAYEWLTRHHMCVLFVHAARLGGDRESMAGAAVQEVVLESTVSNRPGVAPVQLMLPDAVRIVQLPLYRAANFAAHDSVQAAEYGDFFELQPQQLKVSNHMLVCVLFFQKQLQMVPSMLGVGVLPGLKTLYVHMLGT